MTDTKEFPPLAHKMGRVIRPAEVNDETGWVRIPISVNRAYGPDSKGDWVTVSAKQGKKAADAILRLEKGDRIVVEGNYKESTGRNGDKVFMDMTAFMVWRAVEIYTQDDDEL